MENNLSQIGILGGGPSSLFMLKRLVDEGNSDLEITIFERKNQLGTGMPYSQEGANNEHITNVSDNEIPSLVCSIDDWVKVAPKALLEEFHINTENFNEYKVLPRIFFGHYLAAQFQMLLEIGATKGIKINVILNAEVVDVIDYPKNKKVAVITYDDKKIEFDKIIICTGHNWPKKYEEKVKGYFDSPYPPSKLENTFNHSVAIRGASLTAIDALRTLARQCGSFQENENGMLSFHLNEDCQDFRIVMHSRNGMLPAVRFHLADSHLQNDSLLTPEEINNFKDENGGFLSLDYIFEKNFKRIFLEKEPEFYERIKLLKVEEFVEQMMDLRERVSPFNLLRAEYAEAEKSIKRRESIYWKEMLGVLSFAMNYPAKYFSAEDMMRLKKTLMPLISIVIAYVPQSSCKEMLALYDAGILDLLVVGDDSEVKVLESGEIAYQYKDEDGQEQKVTYQTFIDCIGQPHLSFNDFPFKSLIEDKTISPAYLKYKEVEIGKADYEKENSEVIKNESGSYFRKVSGIAINDNFQVLDEFGAYNDRIYVMAVPYIGGFNPDYSGLDFSEEASGKIVNCLI